MTSPPPDPPRRGRQLTRKQFDEVMRRASELAAREADQGEPGEDRLAETEVMRIAREVGLPERHVRRALDEVGGTRGDGSLLDRVMGPGEVRAVRVVPGTPGELAKELDAFLATGRLLQRVRRSRTHLLYRPAVDWISQLARAASGTSRKYFIASARAVEVRLEAVDKHRTAVTLVVDPGIRGEYVTGAALGGGLGGLGAGVGAGLATATALPDPVAAGIGVVAFGGVLAGVTRLTAHYHLRKFLDVQAEVEGVLDRLEMEESLEPPPSSWRKWVERNFHGARRLLDLGGDDDAEGQW